MQALNIYKCSKISQTYRDKIQNHHTRTALLLSGHLVKSELNTNNL